MEPPRGVPRSADSVSGTTAEGLESRDFWRIATLRRSRTLPYGLADWIRRRPSVGRDIDHAVLRSKYHLSRQSPSLFDPVFPDDGATEDEAVGHQDECIFDPEAPAIQES